MIGNNNLYIICLFYLFIYYNNYKFFFCIYSYKKKKRLSKLEKIIGFYNIFSKYSYNKYLITLLIFIYYA